MVDRGFDFYAPQTFEDESGRRILIGWMVIPDPDYTNPTVEAGWQHALTLPRKLHIADGRLVQTPLKELQALRRNRRVLEAESRIRQVSAVWFTSWRRSLTIAVP